MEMLDREGTWYLVHKHATTSVTCLGCR